MKKYGCRYVEADVIEVDTDTNLEDLQIYFTNAEGCFGSVCLTPQQVKKIRKQMKNFLIQTGNK